MAWLVASDKLHSVSSPANASLATSFRPSPLRVSGRLDEEVVVLDARGRKPDKSPYKR